MDDLLLNPITKKYLLGAIKGSHHAIALIGPDGFGKSYTAYNIAKQIIGNNNPVQSITIIKSDDLKIGIDKIRDIRKSLKLKTTQNNENKVNRVIIIENAQFMTNESQNALLKILEEPPIDSRLILTINSSSSVKPTILSRVQSIHIKPCSEKDFIKYFSNLGYKTKDIIKAYLISNGSVGLCASLLADESHPLITALAFAKELLSEDYFKRLIRVNEIINDKQNLQLIIYAIKRILTIAIELASLKHDTNLQNKNVLRLAETYQAEDSISRNANNKLVATNLLLRI